MFLTLKDADFFSMLPKPEGILSALGIDPFEASSSCHMLHCQTMESDEH